MTPSQRISQLEEENEKLKNRVNLLSVSANKIRDAYDNGYNAKLESLLEKAENGLEDASWNLRCMIMWVKEKKLPNELAIGIKESKVEVIKETLAAIKEAREMSKKINLTTNKSCGIL